ncbi:MAG: DUF3899 domain-containing protein [Clostridiales bacterium]|nr:DUF3899 domain-containing protein [Clostridiales bacterium]
MTQDNQPSQSTWDKWKPPVEETPKRKWLTRSIIMLVLFAVSFAIAYHQGFRWGLPFVINAHPLSDGFFVVGLFVTSVGLLVWISSTGFFDIFTYAFRSMLVMFTPFVKPENFPNFYDYKTMRADKRQKAEFTTLVMGLVFIVLSLLMLWIYYS